MVKSLGEILDSFLHVKDDNKSVTSTNEKIYNEIEGRQIRVR